MPSAFIRGVTITAPRMPVSTTRTAVSAGMPPAVSLSAMAMGAVVDFAASDRTGEGEAGGAHQRLAGELAEKEQGEGLDHGGLAAGSAAALWRRWPVVARRCHAPGGRTALRAGERFLLREEPSLAKLFPEPHGGVGMIAVIFEVEPAEGRRQEYLDLAAEMRALLGEVDGFISVERFQSLTHPKKMLSLSFFRDEEAVRAWRTLSAHRGAQAKGRGSYFADYRLRIAGVIRDYGMFDRAEAPDDSQSAHPEAKRA